MPINHENADPKAQEEKETEFQARISELGNKNSELSAF